MPRRSAPKEPSRYLRALPKSNSIRREPLGWRLANVHALERAWRTRSGTLGAVMYQAGTCVGARSFAGAAPAPIAQMTAHAAVSAATTVAARFPGTLLPPRVLSPKGPATEGLLWQVRRLAVYCPRGNVYR